MSIVVTTQPIFKPQKRKSSALARRTWKLLAPWCNFKRGGKANPTPKHLITKTQLELFQRHYQGETNLTYPNGRPFAPWHVSSKYIRPADVQEMLDGKVKIYFTGGKWGQTLILIDIDAHNGETDAEDVARRVTSFLGRKNVFVVKSTRGYNLFLKVVYSGSFDHVNQEIDNLANALQRFCCEYQAQVECKGKISSFPDGGCGTLAKLPCYGHWDDARCDEFARIKSVSLDWVRSAATELIERSPQQPKKEKAKKLIKGSTVGLPISDAERDNIPNILPKLVGVSNYLWSMRPPDRPNSEVRLTPEDFAIGLVVLSICALHPNEDDQLPHNRLEAIWQSLYRQGVVSRAFNNSRWAAIRNTLTDCNYLDLVDARYWFNADGGEVVGKAMQWSLKDRYVVNLTTDTHCIYSVSVSSYTLDRWRPVLCVSAAQPTEEQIDAILCEWPLAPTG